MNSTSTTGHAAMRNPSTQAYLSYSYQSQSMKLLSIDGALPRGSRGRGAGNGAESQDPAIDSLDLGNSRRLQPSAETILSMLEEKVNARIEASVSTEEVEPKEAPDYWSAEKTGERIARFALKFYDQYAEKNGGESEETLESFLNLIKGAIGEGFGEARTQIAETSGGEIPSDKTSLIDSTHERVMSVLEEFRQSVLERLRGGSEAPATTESEGATSIA